MPERTVSVIIPVYNGERFLCEALESVFAQTYRPSEVIVVDDGSTDGSRERLQPYMDRIRYIHQENRGVAAARNTGIRASHGRYIAFLDHDDVWLPEMLARQTAFLESHPGTGLVASCSLASEDGSFQTVGQEHVRSNQLFRTFSAADILLRSRFNPSGVVARRSCLESVGLFDEELIGAEDADMWIRIASCHVLLVRLEEPLWRYRIHPNNFSANVRTMSQGKARFLAKAFRQPELRWRVPLRLRVYSELYFERAFVSGRSEGSRLKALGWTILSGLTWPGRLATQRPGNRLVRAKSMVYYCLGPAIYGRLSKQLQGRLGGSTKTIAAETPERTS